MLKTKYVQMPQDDMAQIDQITREYCSVPAKGIPHGVQKDAIQNGWGARAVEKNEAKACETWRFYFELLRINGKDALAFWDEGTVGLTGDLLTSEEIATGISRGTLTSEQRLGRFLARLVSGGNIGPGIFGRGKLVFHAASKTTSILVDSRRSDDGMYIALDRKVIANQLMQPDVPYRGKEAEKFVVQQTGGALQPLKNPGTRVTILDVDPDIVQMFKLSFTPGLYEHRDSLARMIEETWWEIIHKFGAKIFLKDGSQVMEVELHEPLKTIITAKDKQNGVRVHEKSKLTITANNKRYRVKELRFVVLPEPLNEEYREIWLQRKRMKIGCISSYIEIHHKINRNLAGFVTLEPDLEDLVEDAEGTTHYGFNPGKAGVKQIRQLIRGELKEFEQKLGLTQISEDETSQKRLLDHMRELSEFAPELGFITQESTGIQKHAADIIVKDMRLPNPNTLRIEYGDKIGPIDYKLISNTARPLIGVFQVQARQYNRDPVELYRHKYSLAPESQTGISVPQFEVIKELFELGKPLDIVAVYFDLDKDKKLGAVTRRLYLGMEPPKPQKNPVELHVTCKFPHKDTRRVEISDAIRNLRIKATNTTAFDLNVCLTSSVRHLENRLAGRPTAPLFTLLDEKSIVIKGQADHIVDIDDIEITLEKFSNVRNATASTTERGCDIFTSARLVSDSPELGLPHQYILDKVSVPFYLEVDPPGYSIFRDCRQENDPEGPPSRYEGSSESGYIFILNLGHPTHRFIQSRGDTAVRGWYEKEQMLRQAYRVAFENGVYKGPAEQFKDELTSSSLPFYDALEYYDKVVGQALSVIGGVKK